MFSLPPSSSIDQLLNFCTQRRQGYKSWAKIGSCLMSTDCILRSVFCHGKLSRWFSYGIAHQWNPSISFCDIITLTGLILIQTNSLKKSSKLRKLEITSKRRETLNEQHSYKQTMVLTLLLLALQLVAVSTN